MLSVFSLHGALTFQYFESLCSKYPPDREGSGHELLCCWNTCKKIAHTQDGAHLHLLERVLLLLVAALVRLGTSTWHCSSSVLLTLLTTSASTSSETESREESQDWMSSKVNTDAMLNVSV